MIFNHRPARGGLLFESLAFEALEKAPLPSRVSIAVNKSAPLTVAPGDKILCGQALHTDVDNLAMHHASVSGVVTEIRNHTVTIESDGQDTQFQHEITAPETIEEFRNLCCHMGLVGLGGATYPVHKKLQSLHDFAPNKIDTLLINAAECDPAIYCDEALILSSTESVARGITLTWQMTGAKNCTVGIEENKTEAINTLKKHLPPEVQIVCIPAVYPSGAENTLFKLCTGKDGGLRKNHSICFNVATCYSIYNAINKAQPLISRVLTTVTDKAIRNFCVRIGTPVSDLARLANTVTHTEIIHGGQMMGIPIDTDHAVDKSTNSLIFIQSTKHQSVACIRCGACATVCPEDLSPQHLHWHSISHNPKILAELNLDRCIECACCDQVCPSHIELANQFSQAKTRIRHQLIADENAQIAKQRYENRLERLNKQSNKQRRQLDDKSTLLSKSENPDELKKDLIANALKKKHKQKSSTRKPTSHE